jgi:hypothetical protein
MEMSKKNILSHCLKLDITGETIIDENLVNFDELTLFNDIGISLCKSYIGDDFYFAFIDSIRIQAAAHGESNSIAIYKGMMDFIFRVSSMLCVHDLPEGQFSRQDLPWVKNKLQWINNNTPFDFDDDNFWWLNNKITRTIFDFSSEIIFKFVVMHEIGHIHNMHSQRRSDNTRKNSNENINVFENETLHTIEKEKNIQYSDEEIIHSHVREIIADTYAAQFSLDELYKPIKHIPDSIKELNSVFILFQIFIATYFWAMSKTKDVDENQYESYPSHAFRFKAIQSTLLEHGINKQSEDTAYKLINLSLGQLAVYMNKISNSGDFLGWVSQPEKNYQHQLHYKKICEKIPEWSNSLFKIPDHD